tara:strand:+ start:174 stop:497 length:324 start_codon:yes stop_codon:yes gene_type:complete
MNKKLNLAIFLAIAAFVGSLLNASAMNMVMYPKSFIPFWSQAKRGYETELLNINQIVRIVPVFDPKEGEPNHGHIIYLQVYMTDGNILNIEEGFEEFYSRVRQSQDK